MTAFEIVVHRNVLPIGYNYSQDLSSRSVKINLQRKHVA